MRLTRILRQFTMLKGGGGPSGGTRIVRPAGTAPGGKPKETVLVTFPDGTSRWLPVLGT